MTLNLACGKCGNLNFHLFTVASHRGAAADTTCLFANINRYSRRGQRCTVRNHIRTALAYEVDISKYVLEYTYEYTEDACACLYAQRECVEVYNPLAQPCLIHRIRSLDGIHIVSVAYSRHSGSPEDTNWLVSHWELRSHRYNEANSTNRKRVYMAGREQGSNRR